jgi:hypothetical protein
LINTDSSVLFLVVERSRNELAKIRQEVSPFYWFIHIDSHLALPLFRMLQKLDLLSEDCTIFPAGSGLFVGLFSQVGLDATGMKKGLNLSCEIISESFIGDEDLQREVLIISPTP